MYGSTFTLIFKVKRLSCGAFDKAKSRLVAGGHRAIEDVHYFNSSSHMVTAASMRIMAGLSCGEWGANVERLMKNGMSREQAIAKSECCKLHSIDIAQAYIIASWLFTTPTSTWSSHRWNAEIRKTSS